MKNARIFFAAFAALFTIANIFQDIARYFNWDFTFRSNRENYIFAVVFSVVFFILKRNKILAEKTEAN
ncbi:MAG: hypothetical protein C5B59_13490 [Bacteroidetes bacterium]|nr:MAG: hypothetical protein C5B59_13490 [Bacteroidota bacterium]